MTSLGGGEMGYFDSTVSGVRYLNSKRQILGNQGVGLQSPIAPCRDQVLFQWFPGDDGDHKKERAR